MKKRTFDEMISHFHVTVSEMQITQKQKMELLGMITAIAMKHNESVKHGHWVYKWNSYFKQDLPFCSVCETVSPSVTETDYCSHCGALMDEVTE